MATGQFCGFLVKKGCMYRDIHTLEGSIHAPPSRIYIYKLLETAFIDNFHLLLFMSGKLWSVMVCLSVVV